jgi:hypothetical protein
MPKPSPEELLQRVRERYGSLERPDFLWVGAEYNRDPYAELRRALASRLEVKDVTDLKSDVSVAYELTATGGSATWRLRLSLVGPYAVLLRRDGNAAELPMDGPEDATGEVEAFVVQVCRWANCALLPLDLLAAPVPLRLVDVDEEELDEVSMYQALF